MASKASKNSLLLPLAVLAVVVVIAAIILIGGGLPKPSGQAWATTTPEPTSTSSETGCCSWFQGDTYMNDCDYGYTENECQKAANAANGSMVTFMADRLKPFCNDTTGCEEPTP